MRIVREKQSLAMITTVKLRGNEHEITNSRITSCERDLWAGLRCACVAGGDAGGCARRGASGATLGQCAGRSDIGRSQFLDVQAFWAEIERGRPNECCLRAAYGQQIDSASRD